MADDSERPSIPLRNLLSTVITGATGPDVETAVNAFLNAATDQQQFIKILRIADREVLILYTE